MRGQEAERWKRFGSWLADERQKLGDTMGRISQRALIGQQQWRRYEEGAVSIRRDTLCKIAHALYKSECEVLAAAQYVDPPDYPEASRGHDHYRILKLLVAVMYKQAVDENVVDWLVDTERLLNIEMMQGDVSTLYDLYMSKKVTDAEV